MMHTYEMPANSSSLEEGGAAKIAKLSAVLRQDVMRKYFDFATQAQKSLSTKDMNACRDETEGMHAYPELPALGGQPNPAPVHQSGPMSK